MDNNLAEKIEQLKRKWDERKIYPKNTFDKNGNKKCFHQYQSVNTKK